MPNLPTVELDDATEAPHELREARRIQEARSRRFVKGPIPLAWIAKVADARSASVLKTFLLVMFKAGIDPDRPFTISKQLAAEFGLTPDARTRALNKLEALGLVALSKAKGKSPCIRLVRSPQDAIKPRQQG